MTIEKKMMMNVFKGNCLKSSTKLLNNVSSTESSSQVANFCSIGDNYEKTYAESKVLAWKSHIDECIVILMADKTWTQPHHITLLILINEPQMSHEYIL